MRYKLWIDEIEVTDDDEQHYASFPFAMPFEIGFSRDPKDILTTLASLVNLLGRPDEDILDYLPHLEEFVRENFPIEAE